MSYKPINKKIGCLILTAVLIFTTILALPVYATGNTSVDFGQVEGKRGEEVTIPVTISDNPGISTFRFRVSYDTDDLQFVSVEKTSITENGTITSQVDLENNNVTFLWFQAENQADGDGVIANLKFKILDTAKGDYPLTVTYLSEDLLDEDSTPIPYTVTDGKITVKGVTVSGNIVSFGESSESVTLKLLDGTTEIDQVITTNGSYAFESVLPGNYTIQVSKADHVTRKYDITVADMELAQDVKIHLLGDITGDGSITTVDAMRVNSHAKGVNLLTDYLFLCGDITNDGSITTVDAMRVNSHAKGVNLLW